MALERREACCAYLPTQPALIQRYTLFHWWPGDARGTILTGLTRPPPAPVTEGSNPGSAYLR